MVSQERLSEEPSSDARIEEWTEETISTTSSDNDEDEKDTSLELVESNEDCAGHFGNIIVKNSSEVQFGNNTYYQGPVTIKQFVYKGAEDAQLSIENGKDNLTFDTDCAVHTPEECCVKSEVNFTNASEKISPNIVDFGNVTTPPVGKGAHWLNYAFHKRRFYFICLAFLLVITIILTVVVVVTKNQYDLPERNPEDSDEQEKNTPIDPPLDPNVNITLSGKLRIIPRLEWVAQPPSTTPNSLPHPVPYVIILHTATENCSDQATCTYHIRYIQTFHMESKGWWDIGYNFLIGGDGYAYEGRGWSREGAHTYGYNTKSIGIGFIGTFNNLMPPKRQILAAQQLIELGVKKGYIAKDYKLLAHRQLSPTQSPGEILYENLKTWPHWSPVP